jgi:hypothetical protein
MAYYIHRIRCWLAIVSAMWAQAGAAGHHAEWQMERDIAKKRLKRAEELREQLIAMRDRRVG